MKKILILGLPGSGKSTLAKKIYKKFSDEKISALWFNGDVVRSTYNDWDFSLDGRLRQAQRMTYMTNMCVSADTVAICDFVCPLNEYRELFAPDTMIWMDTVKESKYRDTNAIFEQPSNYTYRVTSFDQEDEIIEHIVQSIESLIQ